MPDFTYLQSHKKLYAFIQSYGPIEVGSRKNVFVQLVRAVAGQQLSTKAAASIYQRFLNLCGTSSPKPQHILKLSIAELRTVGFSNSKAQYIINIANYWQQHKLSDAQLQAMDNQAVIDTLTQIKGVGKWTVEMLLMFTLGRPDVFAVDDLGIQQGMALLYNWHGLDLKTLKQKMLAKSKKYSPFNTYVCQYIWRYKDLQKGGK
jgi:DNA-3-methyladenine glycosylase II